MFLKTVIKILSPSVRHLRNSSGGQLAFVYSQKNIKIKKRFGALVVSGVVAYFLYDQGIKVLSAEKEKKELVILGSGWGAVNLIKSLKPGQYRITVISPTNYFLYTPLLPSVTVGTVDARSLVEPIRKIIGRKHKNDVQYIEAECTDVDIDNKEVLCRDTSGITGEMSEFKIKYDTLVVAVGSKTATYNNVDIEKYAHKLKSVKQANEIRMNIVDAFETASLPGQSEKEIKRLLNFVVVGGGPTGVEFAGELRDFVENLKKLYPSDLIEKVTVSLVNSQYKVLNVYDKQISDFTEKRFKSTGINVIRCCHVVGINEKEIQIKDKDTKDVTIMPYGMCVWAAGIAPQDITKKLIQKIPDQKNRNALVTDAFLRVKNAKDIYGIGDCATVEFTKLLHNLEELFQQADKDGSGELSLTELTDFIEHAMKQYPEMTQHLSKVRKNVNREFTELDTDHSQTLSLTEFKAFLIEVDNKLKSYPATAQVAAQQGKYLSKLLNRNVDTVQGEDVVGEPFVYSHLGSFAYVGGECAVLQLPIVGSVTNWTTMWLWRAAYLNQAVSWRMEFLICLDWIKAHIFGRDTSRI